MTPEGIICERLKRAGLLAVAERAAKRVELRLADCIAPPPEVTGRHRALWAALAREGKSAAEIAVLVGWPVDVIVRELPRSKRIAAVCAPRPAANAKKAAAQARDLEQHLARYGRAGALVREMCAAACVPIEDMLSGSRLAHVIACRTDIVERLSSGDLGDGISRPAWSSPAIGALLRLDHTTVLRHRQKARKTAA